MSESLRDQLSEAIEQHQSEAPAAETPPAAQPAIEAEASSAPATEGEEKPGRTAGRPRDEKGRLLPGKREQEAQAPTQAASAQAPAAPAPWAIKRPTTWRKETAGVWEKLEKGEQITLDEARRLAEEAAKRDGDFVTGVSTYKDAVEKAKPLMEAMQAFQPLLEQHRIQPAQWITNLGNAHKALALGSPQDKLAMFARLARDYQVPLDGLFVRGQDGQVYLNQQLLQHAPAQQQAQEDPRQIVKAMLAEERAAQTIAQMEKDAEKYPHFQTVRQDMGRLLDSGLAQDLDSAYKAALRLPQHAELFEAEQALARQKEEEQRKAQAIAQAQRARANTVSPRSATPTGQGNGSAKGLRSQLAEAWESVGGGRV